MRYYFDNGNEAKGMSAVAVCFLALLPLADEFADAVLAVACDAGTLPENRTTALRLAAASGIGAALPAARRWSKDGETALLRDAAAKSAKELAAMGGEVP